MSLQDVCARQSNNSLQGFNISKDLIQVKYFHTCYPWMIIYRQKLIN